MITNNIICGITFPLIVDIVSNCSDKVLKYDSSNNLNSIFRSGKLKKNNVWCDVKSKRTRIFCSAPNGSNCYTTEIDLLVISCDFTIGFVKFSPSEDNFFVFKTIVLAQRVFHYTLRYVNTFFNHFIVTGKKIYKEDLFNLIDNEICTFFLYKILIV